MNDFNKKDETPLLKTQRQKVNCPLIGANGHIMNLSSISMQTLIENGQENEALEMWKRISKTNIRIFP